MTMQIDLFEPWKSPCKLVLGRVIESFEVKVLRAFRNGIMVKDIVPLLCSTIHHVERVLAQEKVNTAEAKELAELPIEEWIGLKPDPPKPEPVAVQPKKRKPEFKRNYPGTWPGYMPNSFKNKSK